MDEKTEVLEREHNWPESISYVWTKYTLILNYLEKWSNITREWYDRKIHSQSSSQGFQSLIQLPVLYWKFLWGAEWTESKPNKKQRSLKKTPGR